MDKKCIVPDHTELEKYITYCSYGRHLMNISRMYMRKLFFRGR